MHTVLNASPKKRGQMPATITADHSWPQFTHTSTPPFDGMDVASSATPSAVGMPQTHGSTTSPVRQSSGPPPAHSRPRRVTGSHGRSQGLHGCRLPCWWGGRAGIIWTCGGRRCWGGGIHICIPGHKFTWHLAAALKSQTPPAFFLCDPPSPWGDILSQTSHPVSSQSGCVAAQTHLPTPKNLSALPQ